jgi:MFS family permease
MKKIWNNLWVLTVLGLGLAAYLLLFPQFLLKDPLPESLPLNYPVYAVQDVAGNRYVIDNSRRRVSKINPNGDLVYVIEGGQKNIGHFFYAEEIEVDPDGYLYVLNYVGDIKGFYLEREEILRFRPDGQFDRILYQKNYTPEDRQAELVQRGMVMGLHATGDGLSWFNLDNEYIHAYAYLFAQGEVQARFSHALKYANIVVGDLAYQSDGGVYTAKDGQIRRFFSDGREQILFSADKAQALSDEFVVPWEVALDTDGNIYFIDLEGRGVRHLQAPGRAPWVLNPEILAAGLGEDAASFNYYRLSIAADGNRLICNDEAVVTQTRDGGLSALSAARVPYTWRIGMMLSWIALVLGFIVLGRALWLAYVRLFGARLPQLLLMSIGIVVIVSLVAALSAYPLIESFSKRYQEVVLEKISQIIQITPRVLDSERFASLREQADFNNADYRYIHTTLYDAFNRNRDKWNEGYHFALYRVIDERLYGFMYVNGRINMYMPFDWLDGEGVYDQALAGKIATEVTTDISGDWIYGVGPISDAQGNIVALFETGTDLYYLRLENQRLLKELVLNLITVLVILVLLLIELSYINDLLKRREQARLQPVSTDGQFSDVLLTRPLSFLFFTAVSMSVAFIPLYMKQFYVPVSGLSQEILLALPLSLEMFFFGMATLIGGSLSHHLGWRVTLYFGLIVTAAGLSLSGLAENMFDLNLARAVTGFGSGLSFIALRALINREANPQMRTQAFSHFYAGMTAGINVGAVFGAALAQRIGFSQVFFAGLVILVLVLLFQQIYLRRPRYLEIQSFQKAREVALTTALKLFFGNSRNMLFFITIIFPTYIAGTFAGYYFPLFAEAQGLTVANIGLLIIFSGLFVIYLGPALSVHLERTLGVYKSMLLGSVLWGTSLIIFGLSGNLAGAVAALVLMGITEGFCVVAQNEFFLRSPFIAKMGENRAIGYFELLNKVGETIGPLVFAAALVLGASLGPISLGAGIIVLALLFALVVREQNALSFASKSASVR